LSRPGQLYAQRFGAQLLVGERACDPVAVPERLLAIQAQELRGARLSIRARSTGLTVADVDCALAERRLVISWLNRGTLQLVRSEDYPWLQALTAPRQLANSARRLAQEGVSPAAAERGIGALERALADRGPLSREVLAERIAAAGVRTEGQALIHILGAASLRGLIVRGPVVDGQHAFVLVRDWLGEPEPVDRDAALGELARRYLRGHAPAGDRDLARWAGITLGDARRGLGAIAAELDEREEGLVELRAEAVVAAVPEPLLLGPFEPLLLGWTSREAIIGPHTGLVTTNGIFKPFALVEGRAVGVWRAPGGEIELEPFEPVAAEVAAALERERADIRRFLAG
jgi:hypothetical protein